MSAWWREAGEDEDGGFKAMMVLLLKQTHLQNEVAVVFALRDGWTRESRRRITVRGEMVRCMFGVGWLQPHLVS